MPRPYQLTVEQSYKFVADAVRGCARVLEVGCGRGDVARLLGRDGIGVTALDLRLTDPRPSVGVRFVEADYFQFNETGFDAIVFGASLHHLHPIDAAIEHAAALVAPSAILVADEFDLDAPRPNTARWYYETQELLAAAELYPVERVDPATDADPRMRWLDGHVHDPPLATGRQMLAAIAARFAIRDTTRSPYLYRYICDGLPDDDRGGRVAAHVLGLERKRIAAGTLDAAGLRVVAMKS